MYPDGLESPFRWEKLELTVVRVSNYLMMYSPSPIEEIK